MADAGSPSWDEIARAVEPAPEVTREGARMVVALSGEQDMSTATDVADALAGAGAAGDGDIVVDLSRVQFMDAAIVAVLVRSRNALSAQSRTLTVRGPSRVAGRVLRLCGLTGLIDAAPALASADIRTRVTVRGTWCAPAEDEAAQGPSGVEAQPAPAARETG